MAHELIHADRSMRGVQIPIAQLGYISLETARWAISPWRLAGNRTKTITHTFRLEEFATIGINHHTVNCITENMIRSEHGLATRISYAIILRNWP